jgi:hypothetical protein
MGRSAKVGSGPIWITGDSGAKAWRDGIQGTTESSTSTASASASHGATSNPPCIGWVVASEFCGGQNSTTGIAKRSARRASASDPPAARPARPVTISGCRAAARIAAA